MGPSMEGDVEALPANETSRSDFEMTVVCSIKYSFLVDWGLFLPVARLFAASSSASFAFRPCGLALSPESWRHPRYCFQPWMLCHCFLSKWDVQDL